ncbi:hypothetical protein ACFFLS_10010 [Flavobacterium procerum]|uniref:Uncharacterized protein n=1 Tax=Flavobacterium procerum TaxID=1455569 RepID=A0ABV6BPI9_9FLAO
MKNKYYFFLFFIILSCGILKKQEAKIGFVEVDCLTMDNYNSNYLFKDFPNREKDFSGCEIRTEFVDGCSREGKISNGYKEGKFITKACCCDNLGNLKRFSKEEYFKCGLRDSIFKIIDVDNKVIYETTFKMGTGLWKEFHGNRKIYFEAYTKDGYFTDTLKLYNNKGRLTEKLLYKKDSLVFNQKYDPNIVDTLENGIKVRNTYKQKWLSSYNQPDWLYKKEYENESFTYNDKGEMILKTKRTFENGVEKNYREAINGNQVTKTIRTVKAKDTLFESEKEYKNGQLIKNKFILERSKKNPYFMCTEGYDEQGNKTYISLRMVKDKIKDGIYFLTQTDYFENKKKVSHSDEVVLNVKFTENPFTQTETIEKTYYNLNNTLFKKEYIIHKSGTYNYGCSQGSYSEKFDETTITKTEYYENGHLVKTEENKN